MAKMNHFLKRKIKEEQEKLEAAEKEKRIKEEIEIEKLLAAALKEEVKDITKMEKEIAKVAPTPPPPPEVQRHKAINVFYNDTLKKFVKVVIEYDLASGYSEIVEAEPFTENLAIALHQTHEELAMKLVQRKEKA